MCFNGGSAVSWTDTDAGIIDDFAPATHASVVIMRTDGFADAVQAINTLDVKYSDMFPGTTTIGIISLMAWGLGYMGQPA